MYLVWHLSKSSQLINGLACVCKKHKDAALPNQAIAMTQKNYLKIPLKSKICHSSQMLWNRTYAELFGVVDQSVQAPRCPTRSINTLFANWSTALWSDSWEELIVGEGILGRLLRARHVPLCLVLVGRLHRITPTEKNGGQFYHTGLSWHT